MMLFCLAAGVGAVLRYVADFYLPRYGILLVNIIGSFVAGLAFGLGTNLGFDLALTHIVLGGFTGSLTTYATVALTTAQQRIEHTGSATKTWTLHVGLSLAACLCGYLVTAM